MTNGLFVGFVIGLFLGATIWVFLYVLASLVGIPFPAFWGMPAGIIAGGLYGQRLQRIE